jgi:hypothetical protein
LDGALALARESSYTGDLQCAFWGWHREDTSDKSAVLIVRVKGMTIAVRNGQAPLYYD